MVIKKKSTEKEMESKQPAAADIAATLVWSEPDKAKKAVSILTSPEAVKTLVSRLSKSNDEATVQASFALEALVMDAITPNEDDKRKQIARLLLNALPAVKDDVSLCVIIKYFYLLADTDTMPTLSKLLAYDEPVFTYSLMALQAIGGILEYADFAAAEIMEAFAHEKDKRRKAILLRATLKILHNANCYGKDVDSIIKKAAQFIKQTNIWKGDDDIARMLQSELAFLFPDKIKPILIKQLQSTSKVVRGQAMRTLTRLREYISPSYIAEEITDYIENKATELTASRRKVDGDDLTYRFFRLYPCECSLNALADEFSDSIDLLQMLGGLLESSDDAIQECIANILREQFRYGDLPERVVAMASKLKCDDAKARVIEVLGERMDNCARPFIMSCLRDPSSKVRTAALHVAKRMGLADPRTLAAIIAVGDQMC